MSTVDIAEASMTRNLERSTFSDKQRIVLLEQDADSHERLLEAMNARLGKILWLVVTLIVSTATAALIGALNLVSGN